MEIFEKHPHWQDVENVLKVLQKEKYIAWLAGGCVRDGLLQVPPKDFDVVTNATPDTVESLFPKSIAVGKQFGVIVVPGASSQIEVATFRSDGSYTDGRHPASIVFSTPEEDAARRDFTVNALFFDPRKEEILDFVEGRKDLKDKILRAVGDPQKRFEEDKLRILRGIRFVSQLGFELEPRTRSAIHAQSREVSKVSPERLTDEFEKLLSGNYLIKGLRELKDSRILEATLPDGLKHFAATPFWDEWVLGSGFSKLSRSSRWALWTLKMNDIENQKFNLSFKFSNDFLKSQKGLRKLLSEADSFERMMLAQKRKWLGEATNGEAIEILVHLSLQNLFSRATLKEILDFKHRYPELPQPLLVGKDLLDRKMKPGPELGQVLEAAFEAQLEEAFTGREEAITWLDKKLAAISSRPSKK